MLVSFSVHSVILYIEQGQDIIPQSTNLYGLHGGVSFALGRKACLAEALARQYTVIRNAGASAKRNAKPLRACLKKSV